MGTFSMVENMAKAGLRKGRFTFLGGMCILAIALGGGLPIHAAEVTDMAGRTVAIGRVKKIWPAYPPVAFLAYAIDPSLLVGWDMKLGPESRKYVRVPPKKLPIVGGWFGQQTPNMENLAAIKPDVALVWDQTLAITPGMSETLRRLNIHVLAVRIFYLSDYPAAFRFVGTVMGRKKRANRLASYIEHTLHEMSAFSAAIPEDKKVSVYYAIGPDGLTNDCNHLAFLNDAIHLAGGRNVHQCPAGKAQIGNKIDPERLILYNPNVILTQDENFFAKIYADPRFRLLRAVKNRKVFLVPKIPFNWLCFPPTFMRAIGVRWLAHTLYPERYPAAQLRKETKQFFRLFLGVDINDSEADALLLQKHG